jgi:putative transcriptional regulator
MQRKRPDDLRPMTPEQIEEAARRDPDARPLTPDDLKRMRRTPQVKVIRRALGLTQEEFAARYRIPVGTLRDWEQGRTEPDQPARAYLTVIARDPEAVRRALSLVPPSLPLVPFDELMRDLEEDRNAR